MARNENNYSPIEIEFGDVGDRETDSDAEYYFVSRSLVGEYRDAERTADRDAFGNFAETNIDRRYLGKKERVVAKSESYLGEQTSKYERFRKKRIRNFNRRDVFGGRQAKFATEVGVFPVGVYERRRPG